MLPEGPAEATFDRRLSTIDRFRPFVHREICEPVGILVLLAPHVLERDAVEASSQLDRFLVKLLQPRVLDLVATRKLLDQKLRIRANMHGARADLRHTSRSTAL